MGYHNSAYNTPMIKSKDIFSQQILKLGLKIRTFSKSTFQRLWCKHFVKCSFAHYLIIYHIEDCKGIGGFKVEGKELN